MTFNVGVNAMEWAEIVDWIVRLLPILIPLMVVQFVLMITSIVSLVRKPNPMSEKIVWLLVILLVNTIGPIIYFAVGSNHLENLHAQRQDGEQ